MIGLSHQLAAEVVRAYSGRKISGKARVVERLDDTTYALKLSSQKVTVRIARGTLEVGEEVRVSSRGTDVIIQRGDARAETGGAAGTSRSAHRDRFDRPSIARLARELGAIETSLRRGSGSAGTIAQLRDTLSRVRAAAERLSPEALKALERAEEAVASRGGDREIRDAVAHLRKALPSTRAESGAPPPAYRMDPGSVKEGIYYFESGARARDWLASSGADPGRMTEPASGSKGAVLVLVGESRSGATTATVMSPGELASELEHLIKGTARSAALRAMPMETAAESVRTRGHLTVERIEQVDRILVDARPQSVPEGTAAGGATERTAAVRAWIASALAGASDPSELPPPPQPAVEAGESALHIREAARLEEIVRAGPPRIDLERAALTAEKLSADMPREQVLPRVIQQLGYTLEHSLAAESTGERPAVEPEAALKAILLGARAEAGAADTQRASPAVVRAALDRLVEAASRLDEPAGNAVRRAESGAGQVRRMLEQVDLEAAVRLDELRVQAEKEGSADLVRALDRVEQVLRTAMDKVGEGLGRALRREPASTSAFLASLVRRLGEFRAIVEAEAAKAVAPAAEGSSDVSGSGQSAQASSGGEAERVAVAATRELLRQLGEQLSKLADRVEHMAPEPVRASAVEASAAGTGTEAVRETVEALVRAADTIEHRAGQQADELRGLREQASIERAPVPADSAPAPEALPRDAAVAETVAILARSRDVVERETASAMTQIGLLSSIVVPAGSGASEPPAELEQALQKIVTQLARLAANAELGGEGILRRTGSTAGAREVGAGAGNRGAAPAGREFPEAATSERAHEQLREVVGRLSGSARLDLSGAESVRTEVYRSVREAVNVTRAVSSELAGLADRFEPVSGAERPAGSPSVEAIEQVLSRAADNLVARGNETAARVIALMRGPEGGIDPEVLRAIAAGRAAGEQSTTASSAAEQPDSAILADRLRRMAENVGARMREMLHELARALRELGVRTGARIAVATGSGNHGESAGARAWMLLGEALSRTEQLGVQVGEGGREVMAGVPTDVRALLEIPHQSLYPHESQGVAGGAASAAEPAAEPLAGMPEHAPAGEGSATIAAHLERLSGTVDEVVRSLLARAAGSGAVNEEVVEQLLSRAGGAEGMRGVAAPPSLGVENAGSDSGAFRDFESWMSSEVNRTERTLQFERARMYDVARGIQRHTAEVLRAESQTVRKALDEVVRSIYDGSRERGAEGAEVSRGTSPAAGAVSAATGGGADPAEVTSRLIARLRGLVEEVMRHLDEAARVAAERAGGRMADTERGGREVLRELTGRIEQTLRELGREIERSGQEYRSALEVFRHHVEGSLNRLESLQMLGRPVSTAEGEQQILAIPIKIGGRWTEADIRLVKRGGRDSKKAGAGRISVVVDVSPSELGQVRARMEYWTKRELRLVVECARAGPREWFRQRTGALGEALSKLGFGAVAVEVDAIRKHEPEREASEAGPRSEGRFDMRV